MTQKIIEWVTFLVLGLALALLILITGCERAPLGPPSPDLILGNPSAVKQGLEEWLNFETDEMPAQILPVRAEIAFQTPAYIPIHKRQSPLADYSPAERHIAVGLQLSGFPDQVLVGGFGIEMQFTCDLGPGICEFGGIRLERPGGDGGRLEYLGYTEVGLEDWIQHEIDWEGEQPFYLYGATHPETVWSRGDGNLEIRAAGICPVTMSTPTGTIPIDIGMGRVIMILNFAVEPGATGQVRFKIKDIGENEGWLDSDGSRGATTYLQLETGADGRDLGTDIDRSRDSGRDPIARDATSLVWGCEVDQLGEVAIPTLDSQPLRSVMVPVNVWAMDRIDAYVFDMVFPADQLELAYVWRGDLIRDFFWFDYALCTHIPGCLRFGGAGGNGFIAPEERGTIAYLEFDVIGAGEDEFEVINIQDDLARYYNCNAEWAGEAPTLPRMFPENWRELWRRSQFSPGDDALIVGCSTEEPGTVALDHARGDVGDYLEVPAQIWTDSRIDAVTFDLYYPHEQLSLLDIRRGNLVYEWPSFFKYEAPTPGIVRFAGFGGTKYITPNTKGDLAVLSFEVIAGGRAEFKVYQLLDSIEDYEACNPPWP